MHNIIKTYQVIRYNGLAFCIFRANYMLRLKFGFQKRKFPVKRWSEITLDDFAKPDVDCREDGFLQAHQSNSRNFFFESDNLPKTSKVDNKKVISEAEDILQNRFRYFFRDSYSLGEEPDWFLNPFNGSRVDSRQHWSDVKVFDPDVGDMKSIWEPSRFAWVYVLVRAFAATGDEKYAEKFWCLLESWIEANQPNTGPNYLCGQECAIRLMAMCFAMYAFRDSGSSTSKRMAMLIVAIAVHADRIDGNIDLAISTRTNHSIIEAAGIYTAGLLFPEFKQSERWLKRGKKIFTAETLKQIYEDGSYLQHSMNYHRLMLQGVLWTLRLAELNNDSFCDKINTRFTKAVEFIYQMQDDSKGRVSNYGANDGALILPLNSCDYLDYRPVIQSCWYFINRERLYESGSLDEDLLWLFGDDALKASITAMKKESKDFPVGGYYTLRGKNSWGMIRCHSYRDRVAHIDPLHLDLWADGINLLRDCGSYRYFAPDESEFEHYFKSIWAHNTVIVDGDSPLELATRFTWLPWPKAQLIDFKIDADRIEWKGKHLAYNRSPWNITHARKVIVEDDRWEIIDELDGQGRHELELRWHLPDEAEILIQQQDMLRLQLTGQWRLEINNSGEINTEVLKLQPEGGCQSLYYGEKTSISTLSIKKHCHLPATFKTTLWKESI